MSTEDSKPDERARPADQAPNQSIPGQDPAEGNEDANPRQPGSPQG